ncbi:hypothetical protein BASA50_000230 [Batrachochytrium salamandrivorans]|uniref:RING-CH-type domain-containing protein n=1 Tax=Batrachochytrium salamandrivorans TaxID=1357716 RepID=A0ABQ8EUL6_9FUNG|nr:hypothetical protein BASA62_004344 [Batrachochytrium salamandrivorans]KAH6578844.1 hypothetical protein BASA60_003505 [Batrachochytrium salamandrivorans]KAH6583669.1 hypothetical protein BASA61_007895 [Batrachochytrium salamandrivorans]KAH6586866.1 hypothetical protein BASA50_000230 [Batrachochytrium salamandrivorans]KAH9274661.1 hypothetical protein BASA83_002846 [Batrachochytrium salamandrivorans]
MSRDIPSRNSQKEKVDTCQEPECLPSSLSTDTLLPKCNIYDESHDLSQHIGADDSRDSNHALFSENIRYSSSSKAIICDSTLGNIRSRAVSLANAQSTANTAAGSVTRTIVDTATASKVCVPQLAISSTAFEAVSVLQQLALPLHSSREAAKLEHRMSNLAASLDTPLLQYEVDPGSPIYRKRNVCVPFASDDTLVDSLTPMLGMVSAVQPSNLRHAAGSCTTELSKQLQSLPDTDPCPTDPTSTAALCTTADPIPISERTRLLHITKDSNHAYSQADSKSIHHSNDLTLLPAPNPDLPRCRFCLDDSNLGDLISPCLCIGSAKYVHVHCLRHWRKITTNPYSRVRCEICHTYYKLRYPISGTVSIYTAKIFCCVGYLLYAAVTHYIIRLVSGIFGVHIDGGCALRLIETRSLNPIWSLLIQWQVLIIGVVSRIGACMLLVVAFYDFQDSPPQQPTQHLWLSFMRRTSYTLSLFSWWYILDQLCHYRFEMLCIAVDTIYIVCTLVGSFLIFIKSLVWADIMAPRLLVLLADVNMNDNEIAI